MITFRAMLIALLMIGVSTSIHAASQIPLTLSVTLLSKSQCKFNTASATLAFGNLDPGNPIDVTTTATLGFRCIGSAPVATYVISDDDGLNELGIDGNRMQNLADPAAYLPYTLSLSPTSGSVPKKTDQTLTFTGTVTGSSYSGAVPGSYSDTMVVTLLP